jgi:hypothetical protein
VRVRATPSTLPQAHWSKDYVEHLRTVHLALVAVSAALMIFALSAKPYSAEVAALELHQIQDLRSEWPDVLRKLAQLRYSVSTIQGIDALSGTNVSPATDLQLSNIEAYQKSPSIHFFLQFPKNLAVSAEPYTSQHMFQGLKSFAYFWDKVQIEPSLVYFPGSVNQWAYFKQSHETKFVKLDLRLAEDDQTAGKDVKTKCILSPHFDSSVKVQWMEETSKQPIEARAINYHCTVQGDGEIVLPVVGGVVTELDASTLAEHIGRNNTQLDFRLVFADLYGYAHFIATDSFAALDRDLGKTEVSDTPVFEAFGIKFPASLATIGGTVVLISLQGYFFICVRKLPHAMRRSDEGWDVPWIGIDSSTSARLVLFLTVSMLPVVSLCALDGATLWQIVQRQEHFAPLTWDWTSRVKLLCMVLGLSISVWLAAMCWMNRPQIDDQAEVREDVVVKSPS